VAQLEFQNGVLTVRFLVFLLCLSVSLLCRKGKGRAASQDLRNRKRQYEQELQTRLASLDRETARLAKAEVSALSERRLLKSLLRRQSVPVHHTCVGQPTSNEDNIVPSIQSGDSFEPAVFKSSELHTSEPQQSDLQVLIGNFMP
jgi:hypothetical protein